MSEIRFTKVRQRQLNKFNTLINKKEGNITRANATNLIWSNNLGSQSVRQASAPPREGNNTPQTNSQAGTLLPSREGSNSTPASSQVSGIPPNSPPAIAHLPPQEGSNSTPAGSQSGILLNSPLAIAHLPPREGSNSPQATAYLLLGEGRQFFLGWAIAHLPSSKGSNSSQATALLPPSKGSSIPQATAQPSLREGNSSPQAGQLSNPTRSVRQGHRCSPRHRASQSSQENSTISWEDNPTTTPQ